MHLCLLSLTGCRVGVRLEGIESRLTRTWHHNGRVAEVMADAQDVLVGDEADAANLGSLLIHYQSMLHVRGFRFVASVVRSFPYLDFVAKTYG